MIEWLSLSDNAKRQALTTAARETGLPDVAIEKDWWVTLTLKALFSCQWKENLVFKGGTSLSKGWQLIERFSEDIDLAIDRSVLGFPETFVNATQLRKLRIAASAFLATTFKTELQDVLEQMGVPGETFTLSVDPDSPADREPLELILSYPSVLNPTDYLASRVKIEVSARSLKEPFSEKQIISILGAVLPDAKFAETAFMVPVVEPKRTFLEKAFLLHEEFIKDNTQIKSEKRSRHLYDLEKMMDTDHGTQALSDLDFFMHVVEHRKQFNPIRGIEYDKHRPATLILVPPPNVLSHWETDYRKMQAEMIHGPALSFPQLIRRMYELQERFKLLELPQVLQEQVKAIGLDNAYLAGLVYEAKSQYTGQKILDDSTYSIPVTINVDIYKPASAENRNRRYWLSFSGRNGVMVFDGIKEDDI